MVGEARKENNSKSVQGEPAHQSLGTGKRSPLGKRCPSFPADRSSQRRAAATAGALHIVEYKLAACTTLCMRTKGVQDVKN